jgi:MYXO-CTERM domain-containing protein
MELRETGPSSAAEVLKSLGVPRWHAFCDERAASPFFAEVPNMIARLSSAALVVTCAVAFSSQNAEACGCFAPPDPTVPIVQAGERILFSVNNGVVNANIQIQYAGDAKDFGWLLPLPSVPTLKLGTEELFTQLINVTQPRYFVNTVTTGTCGGSRFAGLGGLAPSANSAAGEDASGGSSSSFNPLVTQASIGPYDYAVLKADRKTEMLQWLTDNRYFIPVGTEDTVGPYIRPGAFFLALKLKSGKATGDIQPVVLEYPSDLPMIPIILTSVAAQPNMGIQVWMLGDNRAIPRNYNHVVINDSQVDWLGLAKNYNDVVIKAISEAPEKHAFITEYAGTADVMKDVLDGPTRFGSTSELAALTDPASFVEYLFQHGYAPSANSSGGFGFVAPSLPPLTKALVLAQLPLPAGLTGVTEDVFLQQLRYYLGDYRNQHPDQFAGWTSSFDPSALAAQLNEKVVQPAQAAGALFRAHPFLTRLYTTLSPEDMTRDPVFSFNATLPPVSRDHTATLRIDCGLGGDQSSSPATLTTEQGWVFQLPNRGTTPDLTKGPASLRIETLAEEGNPTVLVDNGKTIANKIGCGCTTVDPLFGVGLIGLLAARRRRQRS